MSDRARVLIARALSLVSALLTVFGMITIALVHDPSLVGQALWEQGGAISALIAVFFGGFVWVVIPQQPRNGAVWSMTVSALGGGMYLGLFAAASLLTSQRDALIAITDIRPADLSTASALLMMVSVIGVYHALFVWLTFGFLLFPDGRLPSRRWRWVAGLAVAGLAMLAANALWEYRPWNTGIASEDTDLANTGGGVAMVAAVLALVSIFLRFRRSSGAGRDQFKWIVWGAAVLVPAFVLAYVLGGTEHQGIMLGPLHLALAIMLTAYGIAVGKYRLFDVDVVISRTFVYGTLAVVITGLYVAVVAGIGHALGGTGAPNPALAIPATAAAAVAFHPMRERLQRWANRIVYGKKATPYQVLSEFSQRVAAADPALLDQVARSLVEGTGARQAAVWVSAGGDPIRTAVWPPGEDVASQAVAYPIEQGGFELGRLTLTPPPGQRLTDDDDHLARAVAAGMGLALRNQRLTGALQTRVEQLRTSRRRLVAVQDDTRRKLERDLHDGAQQHLVALKVKLGLAGAIAAKDGGHEAAEMLARLNEEADAAVEGLRDFARGMYPPLLASEGLGSAIAAQARRVPIPVTVAAEGIGRYDLQVEATVYFCVAEALQNVTRNAQATEARVELAHADGTLTFEVWDDGVGFDPGLAAHGVGLTNMVDRVDAVEGALTIVSLPGKGTTVRGSIPVGAIP